MGMRVTREIPPVALNLHAEIRQAELEAARPILEAAAEGAPFEKEPRHGEHLVDTAYLRFVGGPGGEDRVELGFAAFWAAWQHERMDYHHEHGHAKFLELAVASGARGWLAAVAERIRARLVAR